MTALPAAEAARVLGVPVGTLRRWTRQGCPHVPGRRGRGHALLVDPDAVREWRSASTADTVLLELANDLPRVLADALVEAWRRTEGVPKRTAAGLYAGAWYLATTATLDAMRAKCPGVRDVEYLPEPIERLRKIASQ